MDKYLAGMLVLIGMLLGVIVFTALTPIHDAAIIRIYEANRKR